MSSEMHKKMQPEIDEGFIKKGTTELGRSKIIFQRIDFRNDCKNELGKKMVTWVCR
jgi:hypothetical protein